MTPDVVIKEALETIAGLAGQVYPLEALKNASDRFVFYAQQEESEEDALDGPTGLLSSAYEIHCVAKTYASLVSLSGAVRLALRALQGTTHGDLLIEQATVRQASPDLKEREVDLYRRMYVLRINYQMEVTQNEQI